MIYYYFVNATFKYVCVKKLLYVMESSENTKLFSRLGKCEVCNEKEAKYTCPRCEVKTCSLPCVTIHKEELNCDGVRNKFMYKHMSNFTNLDLLSDYRFLEETTRNVETFVKDPSKRYTGAKQLPVNLYRLRGAARGRRTILQFLPHNFSRSKENTTYFNWKEQLISWRVEWVFPQADNLKCALSRCVETDPLSKLVNTYLDPDQCEPFYKDKLQFYQSAGLRGVVLLIKAEMKSGTRFYELDASLTLKENLMGKTVIEFPTIYVVLREHKHVFDIIDEEEEIESGTTISKNNLLFNSTELSDSEEEEKEDSDGEKLFQQREGRKRFRGRKRFQHKNRKYPRLNIPNYNTLIKQNST